MPIIIEDKICPHCGGNKWYVATLKNTGQVKYSCFIKKQEYITTHKKEKAVYNKKFHKENIVKIKKYQKEYIKEYRKRPYVKKKLKDTAKKRYVNGDNIKSKKRSDIHMINMTDVYIKKLISSHSLINSKLITQDQIKMYRNILIAKRNLKILKNEN